MNPPVHAGRGPALPTGTVTFLLTDVEGSTRLWTDREAEMGPAIQRHYEILDAAIAQHSGVRPVEQGEGDSVVGAFDQAGNAIAAAVAAQLQLIDELPWLPVRMALHTGDAQLRDERNYVGQTIIRCARLRACAHGQQILVSAATHALADSSSRGIDASDISFIDLGAVRLKDLAQPERVWQLASIGLRTEFPALRSLDVAPNNLPSMLTSFIGRESELIAIGTTLAEHRLVTLAGSGGSGKTRLAIHAATEALGAHPGGVWWVDLARVTIGADVADRIAAATGFTLGASGHAVSELVRHLGHLGDALILLDNAEHVIDDVAEVVQAISSGCPDIQLLITSREPLGVPGELVWRVPSLATPETARAHGSVTATGPTLAEIEVFDSVRLFVDRALRARPNLVLDDTVAPAIASICARLDGIPLAIELAAARARSLPLDKLAAGLDNTFRLLTGGARTALARQQTLLASIAWSVDLLDDVERAVLRRLSVFVAPFPCEAAEVVAADGDLVSEIDVLDVLGRLVDKSLIQFDDVSGRYRMLETVRQFSIDQLRSNGELHATRARHTRWYAQWSTDVGAEKYGIDPMRLLDDVPDAMVALRWAYDESPDDAFRIIAGLSIYRIAIGFISDQVAQYEWMLTIEPGRDQRLWAAAAAATTALSLPLGRSEMFAKGPQIERQLGPEDHLSRARLLMAPTVGRALNGDLASLREIIETVKRVGLDAGIVQTVGTLCFATAQAGMIDEMERHLSVVQETLGRHAMALSTDNAGAAFAAHVLAETFRGNLVRARNLIVESSAPRDGYYRFVSANSVARLGWVMHDQQLIEISRRWSDYEPPPIFRHRHMMDIYESLLQPDWEALALTADQTWTLSEPISLARSFTCPILNLSLLATGRIEVAERHVAEQGVVVDALPGLPWPALCLHVGQAQVQLARHRDAEATLTAGELLQLATASGSPLYVVDALEVLAVLAHRTGDADRAAVLLGATEAARARMGYRATLFFGWLELAAIVDDVRGRPSFTHGSTLDLSQAAHLA